MSYTYQSLPVNDNVNRFSFSVQIKERMFLRKGKMIAYFGNITFQDMGQNVLDMIIQEAFNSPLYRFNYIMASGNGKVILADNYNDVTSVTIENQCITIQQENLLAFGEGLELQESILSGYFTLKGSGSFIISSNGPVFITNPPVRVSPGAVVGWIDLPSPSYYYDMNLKSLFGFSSGEETQIDFFGSSEGVVLIQSSEAFLNQSANDLLNEI